MDHIHRRRPCAGVLASYSCLPYLGASEGEARAFSFATLILGHISLIFSTLARPRFLLAISFALGLCTLLWFQRVKLVRRKSI